MHSRYDEDIDNDRFKNLGHRPKCRDTSGTFTALLARTFKSSLEKVHMITKKVGQKRLPLLGNSNFARKRFGLLVAIHMAFVKMGLIKTMWLLLRLLLFGKYYIFRPQMQLFCSSACMRSRQERQERQESIHMAFYGWHFKDHLVLFRANPAVGSIIFFNLSNSTPVNSKYDPLSPPRTRATWFETPACILMNWNGSKFE